MYLLFGVHNHQPVGNFPGVFKKANQQCYRPFVETLYNYPQIKSSLHFSGSLVDWLLKNDFGLLKKVKEMVQRGQVEILTGGYFEPIFPIIPERDRISQIHLLSNFIKDFFDYEPKGCWIGERVWEPSLVKSLLQAQVRYILLDDFHFLNAGIKAKDLFGYYFTEDEGEALAVFPISKRLRYTIPFSHPAQPIDYLRKRAQQETCATIVDDGEKFGLWPGTHKWVYQEKWLEKFFQLLLKNQDWLNTETISEYMQRHKAQGLCNLASSSYEEMIQWSGGSFNNFFAKYPEANNLHKRMLYVSERLNQQGKQNHRAQRYLYMGQCNCPYWHGVFGGIYLGHLRHFAYRNLIAAEAIAEKKDRASWLELEKIDFDQDGAEELIIKNPVINVFISPQLGGGMFELDFIPKHLNILDTMTRRPETYHQKIKPKFKNPFRLRRARTIHDLLVSKEKGLENFLIYDDYRRVSLLDHFFLPQVSLEDFKNLRHAELGDFIAAAYSARHQQVGQSISIHLQRQGSINYQGRKIPLRVSKQLSLNDRDAKITIDYQLENLKPIPLDIVFGVEFNIAAETQGPPNKLRCFKTTGENIYSLTEDTELKDVAQVSIQDVISAVETSFIFGEGPNLWTYPLKTISASEAGFERNYQQTVLLPHWAIRLEKNWQTKITVAVSEHLP